MTKSSSPPSSSVEQIDGALGEQQQNLLLAPFESTNGQEPAHLYATLQECRQQGRLPHAALPWDSAAAGSFANSKQSYAGFASSSGLSRPTVEGFGTQKTSQADLIHPQEGEAQPGELHLLKQNFQVMMKGGGQARQACGSGQARQASGMVVHAFFLAEYRGLAADASRRGDHPKDTITTRGGKKKGEERSYDVSNIMFMYLHLRPSQGKSDPKKGTSLAQSANQRSAQQSKRRRAAEQGSSDGADDASGAVDIDAQAWMHAILQVLPEQRTQAARSLNAQWADIILALQPMPSELTSRESLLAARLALREALHQLPCPPQQLVDARIAMDARGKSVATGPAHWASVPCLDCVASLWQHLDTYKDQMLEVVSEEWQICAFSELRDYLGPDLFSQLLCQEDVAGNTCLHVVCSWGRSQLMAWLLGEKSDWAARGLPEACHPLPDLSSFLCKATRMNWSPLHSAVHNGWALGQQDTAAVWLKALEAVLHGDRSAVQRHIFDLDHTIWIQWGSREKLATFCSVHGYDVGPSLPMNKESVVSTLAAKDAEITQLKAQMAALAMAFTHSSIGRHAAVGTPPPPVDILPPVLQQPVTPVTAHHSGMAPSQMVEDTQEAPRAPGYESSLPHDTTGPSATSAHIHTQTQAGQYGGLDAGAPDADMMPSLDRIMQLPQAFHQQHQVQLPPGSVAGPGVQPQMFGSGSTPSAGAPDGMGEWEMVGLEGLGMVASTGAGGDPFAELDEMLSGEFPVASLLTDDAGGLPSGYDPGMDGLL